MKPTAIVPNIYETNLIATKKLVFIKRYGWTQELNFKKIIGIVTQRHLAK